METPPATHTSCIFCRVIAGELPSSRAYEDEDCLAIMDIAPLRPGHVLVLPKMHRQHLDELPAGLRAHLLEVGNRIGVALRRAPELRCDGVHFVINDGRAAHQTVPHLHLHVLPRRQGDIAGLLGSLLRRPLQPVLGGADKNELDRKAQAIAAQLPKSGPA